MENTYLTALHGMPALLFALEDPMASFSRKKYNAGFERYYASQLKTFEALETGYNNAIDKEQFLLNMAEELVNTAAEKYEAEKRHSKKEGMLMNWNLCLVGFAFPSLLKYQGNVSQPLADAIIAAWKKQFPQTNLSSAPFEEIESGFHRKWCYITTAVCETFQKPDDCYELTLLRDYRDGYLMDSPDGEALIAEYYDVAPTIVKRINQDPKKDEIYLGVWKEYLAPCISMIEHGEMEECRSLYVKMVRDLQETYFYS
ncbi:MAG: CFI-box-CTERM domain-containing protein [Eubacteriales bacterium]|nr:CFI-box-CTERM domain-containing protein [Eubacteriales bacterium]